MQNSTARHRDEDHFSGIPQASPAFDFKLSDPANISENGIEAEVKPRGRPFTKGRDERRHTHSATCGHQLYQFTSEDRSAGFYAAIAVMGLSIGLKLHKQGRWPNYKGRR